jgi:hypothetical protein
VSLSDGQVLQGLIDKDTPNRVDFIQVSQPPGHAISLIVHPLTRDKITSLRRITPEEHERLRQRVARYRARAAVETSQMEGLELSSTTVEGTTLWQFQGDRFRLTSSTDEATTRKLAVRIDQVFRAFDLCFPRGTPRELRPVEVRVFGKWGEYEAYQRSLGLAMNNPAFYAPDTGAIAAGTDLSQFAIELAAAQRQNTATRALFDERLAALTEQKKQLAADLQAQGVSAEKRKAILALEQNLWDDQKREFDAKIDGVTRRNQAKFRVATDRMFARLYHEAFHAYLDNDLYPRPEFEVPRWLNEGFALIFEAGQMEGETLRIDAPRADALQRLQADLKGPTPLTLVELLTAAPETFMVDHRRGAGDSSRAYLYAWGLAYYLAFDQGLISADEFSEYVHAVAPGSSPVARFEKLIGCPLDEFEPRWREAMQQLKRFGRVGEGATAPEPKST